MDGFITQQLRGLGSNPVAYWGSFAPNGTSAPLTASSRYPRGLKFTVAYAATGVYTVTLPEGLTLPTQPHMIVVTAQADALASYFAVMVIGETTLPTTRTFVIQAHRAGTGEAVAAAAGSRINFAILSSNSTGA